jgi:ribonuclease HII
VERLSGVRDSKQMTPLQRTYWAEVIRHEALAWGIGFASHDEIDLVGLLPATRLAMKRALRHMPVPAEHLLIDAVKLPLTVVPQTALIKGDARSLSIAAASVLAKTARDSLMMNMDQRYPGYDFCLHKGYGTAIHQAALLRLGACDIHRRRFTPVRNLLHFGCLWLEGEPQEDIPEEADHKKDPHSEVFFDSVRLACYAICFATAFCEQGKKRTWSFRQPVKGRSAAAESVATAPHPTAACRKSDSRMEHTSRSGSLPARRRRRNSSTCS